MSTQYENELNELRCIKEYIATIPILTKQVNEAVAARNNALSQRERFVHPQNYHYRENSNRVATKARDDALSNFKTTCRVTWLMLSLLLGIGIILLNVLLIYPFAKWLFYNNCFVLFTDASAAKVGDMLGVDSFNSLLWAIVSIIALRIFWDFLSDHIYFKIVAIFVPLSCLVSLFITFNKNWDYMTEGFSYDFWGIISFILACVLLFLFSITHNISLGLLFFLSKLIFFIPLLLPYFALKHANEKAIPKKIQNARDNGVKKAVKSAEYKRALARDMKIEPSAREKYTVEYRRLVPVLQSNLDAANETLSALNQKLSYRKNYVYNSSILHSSDKTFDKVYFLIYLMESHRASSVKEALNLMDTHQWRAQMLDITRRQNELLTQYQSQIMHSMNETSRRLRAIEGSINEAARSTEIALKNATTSINSNIQKASQAHIDAVNRAAADQAVYAERQAKQLNDAKNALNDIEFTLKR